MAKAVQLKDKNGNKIFAAPWMPLGSIFLTVSNDNPSKYFGGTWQKISGGFLWGCNTAVDNNLMSDGHTKTFNDGGGNTGSTTLTIDQMPAHDHTYPYNINSGGYASGHVINAGTTAGLTQGSSAGGSWYCWTDMKGGGKGHNHTYPNHTHNIPHIGVWVWKRIK